MTAAQNPLAGADSKPAPRRGLRLPGTLDFSGRPPSQRLGAVLAVVALALLGGQGWLAWEARQAAQAEQAGLTQLIERGRAAAPNRAMTAQDQKRHVQIEGLAAELAAPWEDLLRIFESQAGARITLLKFEPDAQSGLLRVTGEARQLAAILAYVAALEKEPLLREVLLTQHRPAREADPAEALAAVANGPLPVSPMPMTPQPAAGASDRIEFTLSASWRPKLALQARKGTP